MQNEKSQLQNKEAAMRSAHARLMAEARAQREAEASAQRLSQVRTVDRSERIRTYNFPENRIADHRTGFEAYSLDHVLEGTWMPLFSRPLRRMRPRVSKSLDSHTTANDPPFTTGTTALYLTIVEGNRGRSFLCFP